MTDKEIEISNLRALATVHRRLAHEATEKGLSWSAAIARLREDMVATQGAAGHEMPGAYYEKLRQFDAMGGTTEEIVAHFNESADIYEREASELEAI